VSLVLNKDFKSFTKSSLQVNYFIRSKPASEDKSPPAKFILIFLLLSNGKEFKLSIERPSFFGIVLV